MYNKVISGDIGNIIFNNGECWGYKQVNGIKNFTGSLSELDSDLEFYHNTDGKVYLYSKTNPYTRFNSIELAKSVASSSNSDIQHLIVLKTGVTIDGLCLKYCGNHAVHGNGVNNVTVQNCEFGWIGGSIQSGTTRYGNAIEFWDNCDNIKILNNRIYQIYDTGITLQCSDAKTFSNFTVTGNTVDYCTFSFEYFLPSGGLFKNINVSGNTFNYSGYGWGDQRSDNEYAAHINSWFSYANPSTEFNVSNNTFNGDYCGGKVSGVMYLIPNHTYRVSYNYKNNTALDGVKGNVRLFGFETAQCTGGMYTISPIDGRNPTWTASANESGTYSYEVEIPEKNNYVTIRCNAFNCNGASVTFSDIYICDITNGLPLPQAHEKIVKKGSAAGTLPQLTADKYNFLGWYSDRDSDGNGTGEEIKASTLICTDTQTFTKWGLKSCTVSINPDGGFCSNVAYNKADSEKIFPQEITNGTIQNSTSLQIEAMTNLILSTPIKSGWIFVGWECDGNILPQNENGKTEITVSADKTITAVWEDEEVFVYNLYAGITASDFIEKYVDTAKYSVSYNTVAVGTDTVFTVTDKNTGKLYKKYRIIIFGDVNGDGWYDGTDAMVVKCIYSGMLSENDVSEAVYTAADCNHDGTIDSLDVELLEQAGVLLSEVDQTKSDTELQTDSAYVEYLNFIDQTVDIGKEYESSPETDYQFSVLEKIIVFFMAIWKHIISFLPL